MVKVTSSVISSQDWYFLLNKVLYFASVKYKQLREQLGAY